MVRKPPLYNYNNQKLWCASAYEFATFLKTHGNLGAGAYAHIDFMHGGLQYAGNLGPTGFGDSPYQSHLLRAIRILLTWILCSMWGY